MAASDQRDQDHSSTKPVQVYLSFASAVEELPHDHLKDADLAAELERHLAPLERSRAIEITHRGRVPAGDTWKAKLEEHLDAAGIIILLVTPSFLASPHCEGEMARALERNRDGKAKVIPILVKPCAWNSTALTALQILPRNGIAVTSWLDRNEAWAEITKAVREAAEDLRERPPITPAALPVEPSPLEEHRSSGGPKVRFEIKWRTFSLVLSLGVIALVLTWMIRAWREGSEWKHPQPVLNPPDLSSPPGDLGQSPSAEDLCREECERGGWKAFLRDERLREQYDDHMKPPKERMEAKQAEDRPPPGSVATDDPVTMAHVCCTIDCRYRVIGKIAPPTSFCP